MNKEEWEKYITWEERVTDKLERWVKYNKPITREQAEETIDFICEQDNVIDRKIRELERYKNIIDELEKWLDEYYKTNRKWYNFELSNHDRRYYEREYINTEAMIVKIDKKLKELKGE